MIVYFYSILFNTIKSIKVCNSRVCVCVEWRVGVLGYGTSASAVL